jgi:hypothetical protein
LSLEKKQIENVVSTPGCLSLEKKEHREVLYQTFGGNKIKIAGEKRAKDGHSVHYPKCMT